MNVGFIKEVFRGVPHIVAVKSDTGVEVKAMTEYGQRILNDYTSSPESVIESPPEGFIFSGFSEPSHDNEMLVKSEFPQASRSVDKTLSISGQKDRRFVARTKMSATKKSAKQIIFKPLFAENTGNSKVLKTSFKARAFKRAVNRTKFAQSIKSNIVAVDVVKSKIKPIPGSNFSYQIAGELRNALGDGFIRKTISFSRDEDINNTARRAIRRAKSLSPALDNNGTNRHNLIRMSIASMGK